MATTTRGPAKRAARTERRTTKAKADAAKTAARRTKPPKTARPAVPKRSRGKVSVVHQVRVGQTLVENVEGHAARAESREFVRARATLRKIVQTLDPNPFGSGEIEAHHGGSIWIHDGAATGGWHLVLNWAGIEWSAQFCCDPEKVDRLRQNAAAITVGFPTTLPALEALGYDDTGILSEPITDAKGIGRFVDSIWNACVPIPKPRHTGALKTTDKLAAGVHNYPEPMCGIPRFMRDDYEPFVVDPATRTAAVVAPVAPRFSGDGRVRVLFAERGNPLRRIHERAHNQGAAAILSPDHPVARRAFALQE
jgi:hypothetical protein